MEYLRKDGRLFISIPLDGTNIRIAFNVPKKGVLTNLTKVLGDTLQVLRS